MLDILERYWGVIADNLLVFILWGAAAGSVGFWIRSLIDRATIETQRERLAAKDEQLRQLRETTTPPPPSTIEPVEHIASGTDEFAPAEDVDEVLETHVRDDGRVRRLMMDAKK